ncbi:MAG: chemotaxis response regulator protein-glutamate methylesterase [Clostridia bacterium]|nr:chemotaxis response regulator protein-glutamate methylesterase [Clostridia bacterium]
MYRRAIRVLVVDDSSFFREFLEKTFSEEADIEVVGSAANAMDAIQKILALKPDVITLDVEMPGMRGIEFLRELMPKNPTPVVVVSSISENVFDAMSAGAVDFVTKPDFKNNISLESFVNELKVKVKVASTANVAHWKNAVRNPVSNKNTSKINLIAIGASTGGTEAIYDVVRRFPADAPGIVIVQHMPPVFTKMYASRLNQSCRIEVKEAENGDQVLPGRALIAPGDYQMSLRSVGDRYTVQCVKGDKVSGHCPSVDVLFRSVARIAGPKAVGIILTGMGADGAHGLLEMRNRGARTFGQDEASSIVYGMPKVAFDIGAVEVQASLHNIPELVMKLL